MGMKRMAATEDLHNKINKVLPKLNVPLRKLVEVGWSTMYSWKEQWLVLLPKM
jgi:hypothetical protein